METKDIMEKVKGLWEYEFTDGEVTEKPIVIVGPDGSKGTKTKLRVYAYGGRIGCIATEKGSSDIADQGYAEHLKNADENYIQSMAGKYPELENIPGNSAGEKLSSRLNDMLGQKENDKDELIFEAEYLDLILKAAKLKFTNENDGELKLMERNVQTAIIKKYMQNDPADSWCIIDMEHAVSEGKKVIEKPDIVVYDKERGFGFIELKYNNRSTDNLNEHYEKTKYLIETVSDGIIKELKRRSRFLMDYGLISREFFEMIDKDSRTDLWHGFLFVGGKKSDAVNHAELMARKHNEIEENENCLFWWFPYTDDSSLDNIDLRYSLENTYKEFVK